MIPGVLGLSKLIGYSRFHRRRNAKRLVDPCPSAKPAESLISNIIGCYFQPNGACTPSAARDRFAILSAAASASARYRSSASRSDGVDLENGTERRANT